MNIIRKYKISKLLNTPLEGKELDIICFIQNICSDLIPFKYTKYPDSIFYMNSNGEWIFEQDNKNDRFYVRYNLVWKVLESDFSMTNEDIKIFIKFMVEESFKSKVSIPLCISSSQAWKMEESFKSKISTPFNVQTISNTTVEEAYKKVSIPRFSAYSRTVGVKEAYKKVSVPIPDDSNTINKSVEENFQKVSTPTYGNENYTSNIEEAYKKEKIQ